MRFSFRRYIVTLALVPFFFSTTWALSSDSVLTFGDVLILYFTDLFPQNNKSISEVVVKYSGISDRQTLRTALQKGIYYGMLPNTSSELHPDAPMNDRSFAKLLQKDF